jgi:glutathione-specific gamma-glutamylcyclotransferase
MELWIFGYGSLIFRPDFPFVARREGFIQGWARRFWQASTDHRGTPESPGRVVTLVASEAERCWGVAYQVAPAEAERVLAQLDYRERAGYVRRTVPFYERDGSQLSAQVIVYVADSDNPNFVGPEEVPRIVEVVTVAQGPSGANRDYVLQLAQALLAMGVEDPHVFECAHGLRAVATTR